MISVIPIIDESRTDSYLPQVHWENPSKRDYTLCGKWSKQWQFNEGPVTCKTCIRIAMRQFSQSTKGKEEQ